MNHMRKDHLGARLLANLGCWDAGHETTKPSLCHAGPIGQSLALHVVRWDLEQSTAR